MPSGKGEAVWHLQLLLIITWGVCLKRSSDILIIQYNKAVIDSYIAGTTGLIYVWGNIAVSVMIESY